MIALTLARTCVWLSQGPRSASPGPSGVSRRRRGQQAADGMEAEASAAPKICVDPDDQQACDSALDSVPLIGAARGVRGRSGPPAARLAERIRCSRRGSAPTGVTPAGPVRSWGR